MKTRLCLTFIAMICAMMLLSFGCEKKTAAMDPTAQTEHDKTKPLQAVDLVGYDGGRLRKSVDRIREANDKHDGELEKMVETGPDQ